MTHYFLLKPIKTIESDCQVPSIPEHMGRKGEGVPGLAWRLFLDLLLEERDLDFKTSDQLSHEWEEQWVKDFINSQLCQQICFCTNFVSFLVSISLLDLMTGSKRKLVDLDLIPPM